MAGLDSYYTPSPLADKLVGYVAAGSVKSAVDFCVGDADLLKAVAKRYKEAKLYGTDISEEAIEKLSKSCLKIKFAQCDFRDDTSLNRVEFLKKRKFDLIVLNPPFTCKGSVVENVEIDGRFFHVSTAMMFLMRATGYLSVDGGIYAILPISCVYSEKDKKAWTFLKENYNACVLDESNKVYFSKKCSPNIALVYVGNKRIDVHREAVTADFSFLKVTDIVRGCVRMQNLKYTDTSGSVPLIHTTNIQNGLLVNLKNIQHGEQLTVDGHGVIIPRVCNPNRSKVALLEGGKTYLLSDCVMIIRTQTMAEAENIKSHILSHWQEFVTIYTGTGAQYTTLERVKRLFGVNAKC